jgi:hypothetical protein
MQTCKLKKYVKNGADRDKSIKEVKVRNGL